MKLKAKWTQQFNTNDVLDFKAAFIIIIIWTVGQINDFKC